MQSHAAGTRAVVSARLDLPDMKFIYTDWHLELGERLREARLDAGYTLEHVGKALRFNWQMMQRYEVATARVHADVLDELAMFYGVDVRWLLGHIPEPHSNEMQTRRTQRRGESGVVGGCRVGKGRALLPRLR